MKRVLFPLTVIAALCSFNTQAAILVGPGGSGTITFNVLPPVGEWSTRTNTGTSAVSLNGWSIQETH